MKFKCMLLLSLLLLFGAALADESTWQCPSCEATCSSSFQFCPYCGAERVRQCQSCGYTATDARYTYCPECGEPLPASTTAVSYVTGHTVDNLSTRSGPSTDFTDLGTYRLKDQDVRIFSICYDANEVAWVQCEITYGGAMRRVYTGLKRFDAQTVDLSLVREEIGLDEAPLATVAEGATLRYGPGTQYGLCKQAMATRDVAVISEENGWAQVQFLADETPWRAWVLTSDLTYNP